MRKSSGSLLAGAAARRLAQVVSPPKEDSQAAPAPVVFDPNRNYPREVPDLLTWVTQHDTPYGTPVRPYHLKPISDAFARWKSEPFRILFSVPPRHGKSQTLLMAFGWLLAQDPSKKHAYVTYEMGLAEQQVAEAREYAVQMGVKFVGKTCVTPEGGGIFATSITGGFTGRGVTGVLIIDDPLKDMLQALSSTYRNRLQQWFQSVAYTRLQKGASVCVVATRWHAMDLHGQVLSGKNAARWQVINMPALSEDTHEKALWPEVMPREHLLDTRAEVGDYVWSALYQGRPKPIGGTVFGEPTHFEVEPGAYRGAIGVDLAYTANTSSDYSVVLVMIEQDGVYYVTDVCRLQRRAPEFLEVLKAYHQRYPGFPMRWYCSGTEIGAADFIYDAVYNFEACPAVGDKFMRAQNVAAGWNRRAVRVPGDSAANPWLNPFLVEVSQFTGVDDDYDDQVDALAAAFDLLSGASSGYTSLKDLGARSGRRM